jgi:nucleotide-binding universal stress UspA family protein
MSKIKHILFPIDFSDRCSTAVPFVAEMARRNGAKITLISVAHPYFTGGLEAGPIIDPQLILDDVKVQLDHTFNGEFTGLTVNRAAMLGEPAREITDFVAANKVDLVMMPTHGYRPFRQLLLGSVTSKVLHDTQVPVWTAAHTSEAADGNHLGMRRVLCAVDVNPASIELMRRAAGFCKDMGAALRLVHAVPSIESFPDRQMDQEFEETLRENARRTIQNLEKAADIEVPICVGAGTVPDVVRQEALQHGSDLVIIGRGSLQETMGRLRTHSYGIIRNAPCPVLSV